MTSGGEEKARIAAGYSERVERLTGALIAAIEDADVSYPQAKHALTRAPGAIIGSNTPDDAARSAAVSVAARAIAGCAESPPLIATHGRTLRAVRPKARA